MNLVKRKTNVKIAESRRMERHPVPVLGIDYKVEIEYKNNKITELNVENKTIKIILPNRYKKMENTRIMLGFAPEEYEITKMKTLGKCDNKKIMIHPEVVKYNRKVIDYIVLHQYCHLKHKNHTKAFFNLLEKYLPDYKKCEEILLNL